MKISAIISIIFALIATYASAIDRGAPPSFNRVQSVIFHNEMPNSKDVEVKGNADVAALVKAVKLVGKAPCNCDHPWTATFVKDKGSIKVGFCDHCFNIIGERGTLHYRMMPKFYGLFKLHTK